MDVLNILKREYPNYYECEGVYIKDKKFYTFSNNTQWGNIDNVRQLCHDGNNNYFVLDCDGKVYSGINKSNLIANTPKDVIWISSASVYQKGLFMVTKNNEIWCYGTPFWLGSFPLGYANSNLTTPTKALDLPDNELPLVTIAGDCGVFCISKSGNVYICGHENSNVGTQYGAAYKIYTNNTGTNKYGWNKVPGLPPIVDIAPDVSYNMNYAYALDIYGQLWAIMLNKPVQKITSIPETVARISLWTNVGNNSNTNPIAITHSGNVYTATYNSVAFTKQSISVKIFSIKFCFS